MLRTLNQSSTTNRILLQSGLCNVHIRTPERVPIQQSLGAIPHHHTTKVLHTKRLDSPHRRKQIRRRNVTTTSAGPSASSDEQPRTVLRRREILAPRLETTQEPAAAVEVAAGVIVKLHPDKVGERLHNGLGDAGVGTRTLRRGANVEFAARGDGVVESAQLRHEFKVVLRQAVLVVNVEAVHDGAAKRTHVVVRAGAGAEEVPYRVGKGGGLCGRGEVRLGNVAAHGEQDHGAVLLLALCDFRTEGWAGDESGCAGRPLLGVVASAAGAEFDGGVAAGAEEVVEEGHVNDVNGGAGAQLEKPTGLGVDGLAVIDGYVVSGFGVESIAGSRCPRVSSACCNDSGGFPRGR